MTRERTDPLVPLLASAVSVVVIAAIALIFYPRIKSWIGPDKDSVVAQHISPSDRVAVWVHSGEDGVALVLEEDRDPVAAAKFAPALEGGPYRLLHLTVYNFRRDEYTLTLSSQGFASPGGGGNARPAVAVVRHDAPAHLRAVLQGFGLVQTLRVARGRRGQALLVVPGDPGKRAAFVSGSLRFERKELERLVLAKWRQSPDWAEFEDF